MGNQLRIAQLTREPRHVAPFARLPLVGELADFLARVEQRLDVRPELRERRLRCLAEIQHRSWDFVGHIPARPIS
jgi:hypothetical protein